MYHGEVAHDGVRVLGVWMPNALPDGVSARAAPVPRVRKPYYCFKRREAWTDEEHERFLEAVRMYKRDWKKIQLHVETRTVLQIRSHAQKYFSKLERNGDAADLIPPPRPKRKAKHPYPRRPPREDQKPTLLLTPEPSNSGSHGSSLPDTPCGSPVMYSSPKLVSPHFGAPPRSVHAPTPPPAYPRYHWQPAPATAYPQCHYQHVDRRYMHGGHVHPPVESISWPQPQQMYCNRCTLSCCQKGTVTGAATSVGASPELPPATDPARRRAERRARLSLSRRKRRDLAKSRRAVAEDMSESDSAEIKAASSVSKDSLQGDNSPRMPTE